MKPSLIHIYLTNTQSKSCLIHKFQSGADNPVHNSTPVSNQYFYPTIHSRHLFHRCQRSLQLKSDLNSSRLKMHVTLLTSGRVDQIGFEFEQPCGIGVGVLIRNKSGKNVGVNCHSTEIQTPSSSKLNLEPEKVYQFYLNVWL